MTTTADRRVVGLDPDELGIDLTSAVASGSGSPEIAIAVSGEIDAATAPRLAAGFERAAALRPPTITVDLTNVPFMDSSGVNAIVDLCARASAWGGQVVLTGLVASVRRVCDIIGIEETEGLVLR